ncbi:MAG: hypothetical protein H0W30_19525 [Gemmatimonadaceae bacterium]|nr:hypothetical protein [Gemmatimonadaceae bacterium]
MRFVAQINDQFEATIGQHMLPLMWSVQVLETKTTPRILPMVRPERVGEKSWLYAGAKELALAIQMRSLA